MTRTLEDIDDLLRRAETLLEDCGEDGLEALEHLHRCQCAVENMDANGGFNDVSEARMLDNLQRVADMKAALS